MLLKNCLARKSMEGRSDWLKETKGTAGQGAAHVAEVHLALAADPVPGAGSPTAALVAAAVPLAATAVNQDLWAGHPFKTNLKRLLHLEAHPNLLHLQIGKGLGRDPDLLIAETELFIHLSYPILCPLSLWNIYLLLFGKYDIYNKQEHTNSVVWTTETDASCLLLTSTCLWIV